MEKQFVQLYMCSTPFHKHAMTALLLDPMFQLVK